MRRILFALSLATLAASAAAQTRFTLERIEVRNAQHLSPRLVIAETLLREGSEVSEEDVRAGVRRLARSPFVFAATYTLENGVLVIDVTPNRRFWFLVDARGTVVREPAEAIDYDFVDMSAEWKETAGGVRWLFGDGGIAHFAMTVLRNRHAFGTDYSAYEIGYTRHHLFGTRVFATVKVRSPVDSLEEKTFTPEVIAGIPLSANQTLTLGVQDTLFRQHTVTLLGEDFRRLHAERTITASWTYDTTNEPYTPTRGTFVRVEPILLMTDRASFARGRPPLQQFTQTSDHSEALAIDVFAERYWELSSVSSVSAGVQGGWGRLALRQNPARVPPELRSRPSYEIVQAGYARKFGRSRVEVDGRVVFRQVILEGTSYEVMAAWAQRRPWGTLRLGFGYTQ